MHQRYENLKKLIESRRSFEKNHRYPPYTTYPTTINFFDKYGKTLLHYAAELGYLDDIKLLLSQDADIFAEDFNKKLSFVLALKAGHVEVANYLYQQSNQQNKILSALLENPIENTRSS